MEELLTLLRWEISRSGSGCSSNGENDDDSGDVFVGPWRTEHVVCIFGNSCIKVSRKSTSRPFPFHPMSSHAIPSYQLSF
jgi:hypothetical protein